MINPEVGSTAKPWWGRARVKWLAGAIIFLAVLGFIGWLLLFRPYVSTNDARVATDIMRVSPVAVGGVIEKVLVEEGDFVKAGQIIAEIDRRVPQAQYEKAEARYELARLELDRIKNLAHSNYSPTKDLDSAKTNFQIAGSELKLAKVTLENTYLKSPVDGVVIQKIAVPGNVIEPGEVAVVISDADHAWVAANIEETHIARVKVGQPVAISIDEGGTLTGRVKEILSATASQFSLLPAENASGNFTKVVQRIPVKISLDPHPGRILRAGESVTVRIKVR